MTSSRKTFVVLDGNALLHRAWHAIPPLTTKDGLVVNAVYGFANVLEKMLPSIKPDMMAVAWDLPGKTFRHEAYKPYKAQREKKAQELYDQIPLIQEMLAAYGIPSLSAPGFEADDILGTLAKKAAAKGMKTIILTGDLDALQLVDDDTEVMFFQKGISETKTYDAKAVKERYGLDPVQLIDYKALRGDPSDNLPGVAGIGEKTATLLLQEHGTLKGIYAALKKGEILAKYAKKLEGANEDTAKQMLELVTIRHDVPLKFSFKDAEIREPDWGVLLALWRTYEFRTLLKKYADKNPGIEAPPMANQRESKPRAGVPVIIRSEKDAGPFLRSLEGDLGVLVATQAKDLFGNALAAIALTDGVRTGMFPQPATMLPAIKERLSRASRVVTHDAKHLLHATGGTIVANDDVMIAGYLINSGRRAYDLATIADDVLGAKIPELPESFATDAELLALGFSCAQLPAIMKVATKTLEDFGSIKVYREIEMPLIPVLYDMETAGVLVDAKVLGKFADKLGKRLGELEKQLHEAAGEVFNVNSPGQLSTILFDKLHLPTKGIKKTQGGYSTAAPELEKLGDAHPILELIGEYRELSKLKSTYADVLPTLLGNDGRIHTTFNQTIAATGRLSSTDPNLQNIPIKTDMGNEIRRAFIAGKGKKLIAADYSQIELRLASIIAKDEPFVRAFREGADIHTRTASEVWDVPEDKVTSTQRRNAKAINFGILYGMGQRSLARSTGMSTSDAAAFIDKYFQIHHKIREYMDETIAKAHTQGYVETLFGRRRSFPEISSGVPMLVATAERMAINMPIQGTQADVVKLAMIAVHGWLKKSEWHARLILTVHDELVVECDANVVDAVAKGLKDLMEGVVQYEVPLTVEVETGDNWADLETAKKD